MWADDSTDDGHKRYRRVRRCLPADSARPQPSQVLCQYSVALPCATSAISRAKLRKGLRAGTPKLAIAGSLKLTTTGSLKLTTTGSSK